MPRVCAKRATAVNGADRDRPAFGGAVRGAVRESLENAAACYGKDPDAAALWLDRAAAADPDALAIYFARYKLHFPTARYSGQHIVEEGWPMVNCKTPRRFVHQCTYR